MSIISHRVLQRFAANSMTRRGSVIAASTYCPSTPESCLTSQPTSSPLPAIRVGAITTQRRHFRQTSPRATPVVIDLDQIASYVLLAACAIFFVRHVTGYSTLPPHTWARTADESTRRDVEATMSVAFNTARAAPTRQRHSKLREATFHVPHELARLNKKAPWFRLEDLGPLAPGKIPWVTQFRTISKDGPPLDAKTETRAFLYFPDGSPKATAVFLAVNSELMYPRKALKQSPPVRDEVAYSRKPLALLRAFRIVYQDWEDSRPSVTARIVETSRLPIICNFQENVFGCIFYPVRKKALNTRMGLTPLDITDFDRKTSML